MSVVTSATRTRHRSAKSKRGKRGWGRGRGLRFSHRLPLPFPTPLFPSPLVSLCSLSTSMVLFFVTSVSTLSVPGFFPLPLSPLPFFFFYLFIMALLYTDLPHLLFFSVGIFLFFQHSHFIRFLPPITITFVAHSGAAVRQRHQYVMVEVELPFAANNNNSNNAHTTSPHEKASRSQLLLFFWALLSRIGGGGSARLYSTKRVSLIS